MFYRRLVVIGWSTSVSTSSPIFLGKGFKESTWRSSFDLKCPPINGLGMNLEVERAASRLY